MSLGKNKEEMDQLKKEKGESVIPKGSYCYSNLRPMQDPELGFILKLDPCPYWDYNDEKEDQSCGYCWFINAGDWEENGTFLLWDQCKECGIKDEDYMDE